MCVIKQISSGFETSHWHQGSVSAIEKSRQEVALKLSPGNNETNGITL